MGQMRSIIGLFLIAMVIGGLGCARTGKSYGTEQQLALPTLHRQVWAVAPAVDLSGQQVDPILQADLLFQQLQQVRGLTVIPVNRVVEVYSALRLTRVQSEEQAALVIEMLGCDALIVPTITAFDPYHPPKFGVALQWFGRGGSSGVSRIDPRELTRRAAPDQDQPLPRQGQFVQVVGMFDAANGSVREAVRDYARGRSNPTGPMGWGEYLRNMDRYCGFVYHTLTDDLLRMPQLRQQGP